MKKYSVGYYDCECGSVDTILYNEKEYSESQFIDLVKDIFDRIEKSDEDYNSEDGYRLTFDSAIGDIVTILINEFGFIESKNPDLICRFSSNSIVDNLEKL